MRTFDEIFDIAARRKGGAIALEGHFTKPLPTAAIAATTDDIWLSCMAKCIFQAGFSWKVIESKWPGFEQAFDGFSPARIAMYSDEDLDRLISDRQIVRNPQKITAVMHNAYFLNQLAQEHGSAALFFAHWPETNIIGLLDLMKKRGARLGGATGQRVLRGMGKACFVLSDDVTARLIAEGVVDKSPSSKRDMAAVQMAFNNWAEQSGRSLTEISQTLAMSVGV